MIEVKVLFLILLFTSCMKMGGSEKKETTVVPKQWAWNTPQSDSLKLARFLETIAGHSAGSFEALDGYGTYALFYNPIALTGDEKFLYVADGSAIRKINKHTAEVTTLVGDYLSIGTNIDGDSTTARLDTPSGIILLGKRLYVTDIQNTIRQIDVDSGAVTTIAGLAGSIGLVNGIGSLARFNDPRGITTNGVDLFIADSGNNSIRKLSLSTFEVTTIAGSSTSGFIDGIGAAARFSYPMDLVTDGRNLYITDTANNSIRKIDLSTHAVRTFAGPTSGASGSSDGRGQSSRFNSPFGITADANSVYLADFGNCTIRRISKSTADVKTFSGVAGECGTPVDGAEGINRLSHPTGVFADNESLFIIDENEIRRLY